MSSPLVESLPNLDPLMDFSNETDDSGFPFDNSEGRFQSKLDDIARRHPEFADHLSSFARQREPGASSTQFRDTHRPSHRVFGDTFDNFADFDDFDLRTDPFFQRRPVYTYKEEKPAEEFKTQKVEKEVEKKPPKPEESKHKHNPTIQQSNTVDLGQKQEPVDDNRNQRSMSAPPENRTGRRFVSSINIPNLNTGGGDMGAKQTHESHPQPQQTTREQNRPHERIIPIHIEGSDEPILPKNPNVPFSSNPQPERIFGQKPSNFTQFIHRNEQEPHHQAEQEDLMRQQFMKQQQEYQQQQQQNFQKQQAETQAQPQQPQQTQKPKTPLDLIQSIQKDVSELMSRVEKFAGKKDDKEYLYLEEMFTRNLIRLDNVETEGKDVIRQARKEAIKCIERCIQILESKAAANEEAAKQKVEEPELKMEIEPEKKETTPMEIESAATEPAAIKLEQESKTNEQNLKTEENKTEEKQVEEKALPLSENQAEEVTTEEIKPVIGDAKIEETTSENKIEDASQSDVEKAKVKKKK